MSKSETILGQAKEWLASEEEGFLVKIYINLGDIGWVTAVKFEDIGDLIKCDYQTGLIGSDETIVCAPEVFTGVRRTEDVLGRMRRSWGSRGE